MTSTAPRRKVRARIRYANNPEVRAAAKARSRKQAERLKTDHPAYRERRNAWQRRWQRKRKAKARGSFESNPPASGSDRDDCSVSDAKASLKSEPQHAEKMEDRSTKIRSTHGFAAIMTAVGSSPTGTPHTRVLLGPDCGSARRRMHGSRSDGSAAGCTGMHRSAARLGFGVKPPAALPLSQGAEGTRHAAEMVHQPARSLMASRCESRPRATSAQIASTPRRTVRVRGRRQGTRSFPRSHGRSISQRRALA